MAKLSLSTCNFTAGELAPVLLGRSDLSVYYNGARRLTNFLIAPCGGISRRPGFKKIAKLANDANIRLLPFLFSETQNYLLILHGFTIEVWLNDKLLCQLASPWPATELLEISYAQTADTMLLTHPLYPPQILERLGEASWQLRVWNFVEENGRLQQPYYKFAENNVTLKPSATSGAVTLTASANLFDDNHIGVRMRLQNKEVVITSIVSKTVANATTKETLANTNASEDWEEAAFSPMRGWPTSLGLFQDRLVVGGSRDLPTHLFLSQSADYFNFDCGTGLDNEAIMVSLLSDQVNPIRNVFSGHDLQIFTSGAEWMASGQPLTPSNCLLTRQSRYGSVNYAKVPPVDVDQATLYPGRDGQSLLEFRYDDGQQGYGVTDLAGLSSHLCQSPLALAFDRAHRQLFVMGREGQLSVLTLHRNERVMAWTGLTTDGSFLALANLNNDIYVVTKRATQQATQIEAAQYGYFLERLSGDYYADQAMTITSLDNKPTSWSNLEIPDMADGTEIMVVADGLFLGSYTLDQGQIKFSQPVTALSLKIGRCYISQLSPLPPQIIGNANSGRLGRVRLVKLRLQLYECLGMMVDSGLGLQPLALPLPVGATLAFDKPRPAFSGEISLTGLGWQQISENKPLWQIAVKHPYPATILGVTMELAT